MPDFILSTGGKPWIENFRNEEKARKAVNYRGYKLTSIELATAESKEQFERKRAHGGESPKPEGPGRQVRKGGERGVTEEKLGEPWDITKLGKPLRLLSLVLAFIFAIPVVHLFYVLSTWRGEGGEGLAAIVGLEVVASLLFCVFITIHFLLRKTKCVGILVAIVVYIPFFLIVISFL